MAESVADLERGALRGKAEAAERWRQNCRELETKCQELELRDNREIILAAVERRGMSLSLASKALQSDTAVALAAVRAVSRLATALKIICSPLKRVCDMHLR